MGAKTERGTMSEGKQAEIKPVFADVRMSSVELVRMAEADGGSLRHVAHLLASSNGSAEFRIFCALNEHILFSKAKHRQAAREALCAGLPEVVEAGRKAAEEREALVQAYADRDAYGELAIDQDDGENDCIRISDDAKRAEFSKYEQAIVDGYQQALAVLTDATSAGRPAALKAFDAEQLRVRINRIPWRNVPEAIGGGMLLAALPFFEGVPKAAVAAAERLRDMEHTRTRETVESVLAWQGVRPSRAGDGASETPDVPPPALPPFMMGANERRPDS